MSGSNAFEEMRQWRHWLHQHPELAFEEHQTSDFVAARLEEFGLAPHRGLAHTGVVASITGNRPGPTQLFRADMDALPIIEANDFAHRSQHAGKMHACGHDGHTSMLLGAAKTLAASRDFPGTVHCLFQPAEERLAGAKVMLDEGLLERFPCDAVYAMHNWPGLATGELAVHDSAVMAATIHLNMTITGHGCHSAMPHLGRDPILAASQLVIALQSLVAREIDPAKTAVVSVTKLHAGEVENAIPDYATLHCDIRYFDPDVGEQLAQRTRDIAQGICAASGVTLSQFDLQFGYPATFNHADHAAHVAQVASAQGLPVQRDRYPSMAAEDFSYLLQQRPGAYVWLGNGPAQTGAGLHNPGYDFNDKLLTIGSQLWVALAQRPHGTAAT